MDVGTPFRPPGKDRHGPCRREIDDHAQAPGGGRHPRRHDQGCRRGARRGQAGRPEGWFGDHERTIIAGLKGERADPKEIEGLQALFVVNLEPRKLMGVLSEGMVFDIGYSDGLVPVLAAPEWPVPDGTRAG
jgi:hypothetical protein